MGKVIQLKQTSTEPPARSPVQSQLNAFLLTLAEIEVGKAQIETDIRVVESVMSSTKNLNLQEITLQQLTDIKNQLLLASLKLLDAKRGLLGLAASNGMADRPLEAHSNYQSATYLAEFCLLKGPPPGLRWVNECRDDMNGAIDFAFDRMVREARAARSLRSPAL